MTVGSQAAGRPTKKPRAKSNGSQKPTTTKPGGGGPLPAGEPTPKGRREEEAVGLDSEKRPHPSGTSGLKATAPRAVSRGSSCGDPGPRVHKVAEPKVRPRRNPTTSTGSKERGAPPAQVRVAQKKEKAPVTLSTSSPHPTSAKPNLKTTV